MMNLARFWKLALALGLAGVVAFLLLDHPPRVVSEPQIAADKQAGSEADLNTPASPVSPAPDISRFSDVPNDEIPDQTHASSQAYSLNKLPPENLIPEAGNDLTQKSDRNLELDKRAPVAAETGESGEAGRALELSSRLFSGTPINPDSGQDRIAQSTSSGITEDVAQPQADASVPPAGTAQETTSSQADLQAAKQRLVIHVPAAFSAADTETITKQIESKLGTQLGDLRTQSGARTSGSTAVVRYHSPASRSEARAVANVLQEIGYHWRIKRASESPAELIEVWIPPNRAR